MSHGCLLTDLVRPSPPGERGPRRPGPVPRLLVRCFLRVVVFRPRFLVRSPRLRLVRLAPGTAEVHLTIFHDVSEGIEVRLDAEVG